MSIGVPAIVSDFGGNPYMVRNGVNGYVYPRGDCRALARCIKKLADKRHGGVYLEMSDNCFRRFEAELNAQAMTQKTEELYFDLIGRASTKRKRSQTEGKLGL